MRVVIFCHSLISDWNHGNAHFLRGVATELMERGNSVSVFEPRNAWSMEQLLREAGPDAVAGFQAAYPSLTSTRFDPQRLDLDEALEGADVVLVHEWNEHALVERIGRHRAASGRYVLLFHDTHHRSVSDAGAMAAYDLQHYDGVLAFGDVIRERYVQLGWARRAWTWHEAADVRRFRPLRDPDGRVEGDLVWIGNWGDNERSDEIREFLMEPAAALSLRTRIHGVQYPAEARSALAKAGIEYAGWLPNYRVPDVFGRFAATVHIPRRPYVKALPGIPTIRMFEGLACGIPLVSTYWEDREHLFTAGEDYLVVRTAAEMRSALRTVIEDRAYACAIAANGLAAIRERHTCAHRVNELFEIVAEVQGEPVQAAAWA